MHAEVLALCQEKFKQLDEEKKAREAGESFLHKRISDNRDEVKKELKGYTDKEVGETKKGVEDALKVITDVQTKLDKYVFRLLIWAVILAGTSTITMAGFLINLALQALNKKTP